MIQCYTSEAPRTLPGVVSNIHWINARAVKSFNTLQTITEKSTNLSPVIPTSFAFPPMTKNELTVHYSKVNTLYLSTESQPLLWWFPKGTLYLSCIICFSFLLKHYDQHIKIKHSHLIKILTWQHHYTLLGIITFLCSLLQTMPQKKLTGSSIICASVIIFCPHLSN